MTWRIQSHTNPALCEFGTMLVRYFWKAVSTRPIPAEIYPQKAGLPVFTGTPV